MLGHVSVELSFMERRKPGRKSKGDRVLVRGYLPRPLVEAMKSEAARRGMTLTDFMGRLAASELEMTYDVPQEALPISA